MCFTFEAILKLIAFGPGVSTVNIYYVEKDLASCFMLWLGQFGQFEFQLIKAHENNIDCI